MVWTAGDSGVLEGDPGGSERPGRTPSREGSWSSVLWIKGGFEDARGRVTMLVSERGGTT